MATRIAPRIYRFTVGSTDFEVNGQIHEDNTREWQLFEVVEDGWGGEERIWCETYATKRDAIAASPAMVQP